MKHKPTLTGTVLTTAHNAWLQKDRAQDRYVKALLTSYFEAHGERQKDAIYRVCSGKRIITSNIARYYSAEGDKLYADIYDYYDTALWSDKQRLQTSLYDILDIIPRADRTDITARLSMCSTDKCNVCMLYALLLDYAWHVDIAGYTYVATQGGDHCSS